MSYNDIKRTKLGKFDTPLKACLLRDMYLSEKEFIEKYKKYVDDIEDLKDFYWTINQLEFLFEDEEISKKDKTQEGLWKTN